MLRIALVEDDPVQAEMVDLWLRAAGHDCHRFEDGESFVRAAGRDSFDVVLLDWNLPGMGGDEVLARFREQAGWAVPVLFVTGRDAEEDIVQALEAGADDYLVKPVTRAVTLARVAALDRRARGEGAPDGPLEVPPFTLDAARETIHRDGERLDLTRREYVLCAFLLRNAGRLVSRSHLLEHVWDTSADLNTRTVDTHMSRIRVKLGLGPECGWRLTAVYRHGYRLERAGDD